MPDGKQKACPGGMADSVASRGVLRQPGLRHEGVSPYGTHTPPTSPPGVLPGEAFRKDGGDDAAAPGRAALGRRDAEAAAPGTAALGTAEGSAGRRHSEPGARETADLLRKAAAHEVLRSQLARMEERADSENGSARWGGA